MRQLYDNELTVLTNKDIKSEIVILTYTVMLSVEASYCILVGTGNGFFIFMFIYAIPYIANRLRWKSCVVVEMNCNVLETFAVAW